MSSQSVGIENVGHTIASYQYLPIVCRWEHELANLPNIAELAAVAQSKEPIKKIAMVIMNIRLTEKTLNSFPNMN